MLHSTTTASSLRKLPRITFLDTSEKEDFDFYDKCNYDDY
jgi:hypothetical protein